MESLIRMGCFLSVLAAMGVWEVIAPRRKLTVSKGPRWVSNLGLVVLNGISTRILIPVTAVGFAEIAHDRGWGLLNIINGEFWPEWMEIVITVVAFDLLIYIQHVMFHAIPAFWRLHMVHHADLDFDVTTGLRFHTLEILLSMIVKLTGVLALGPPAPGVMIFEVVLNATAMFNHSNVRLPTWLDQILRCVLVTPDMHRVHHSTTRREANSNYGFNLPWWDFLLGTYLNQPAAGHIDMTIGITQHRDELQVERLPGMLLLPFVGTPGAYPINKRDDDSTPMQSTSKLP